MTKARSLCGSDLELSVEQFEDFYEAYFGRVYGFAARRTRSRAAAEALASAIFEDLVGAIASAPWPICAENAAARNAAAFAAHRPLATWVLDRAKRTAGEFPSRALALRASARGAARLAGSRIDPSSNIHE